MSTDSDSGSEMCLEPLCPYCGHQGHQEPECPAKASRIEATANLYLAASTQNPVKTSALIKLADTIQLALPAAAALPVPRPAAAAAAAKAKLATKRLTEFQVVIPVKPKATYYGYSSAYPCNVPFAPPSLGMLCFRVPTEGPEPCQIRLPPFLGLSAVLRNPLCLHLFCVVTPFPCFRRNHYMIPHLILVYLWKLLPQRQFPGPAAIVCLLSLFARASTHKQSLLFRPAPGTK